MKDDLNSVLEHVPLSHLVSAAYEASRSVRYGTRLDAVPPVGTRLDDHRSRGASTTRFVRRSAARILQAIESESGKSLAELTETDRTVYVGRLGAFVDKATRNKVPEDVIRARLAEFAKARF